AGADRSRSRVRTRARPRTEDSHEGRSTRSAVRLPQRPPGGAVVGQEVDLAVELEKAAGRGAARAGAEVEDQTSGGPGLGPMEAVVVGGVDHAAGGHQDLAGSQTVLLRVGRTEAPDLVRLLSGQNRRGQ